MKGCGLTHTHTLCSTEPCAILPHPAPTLWSTSRGPACRPLPRSQRGFLSSHLQPGLHIDRGPRPHPTPAVSCSCEDPLKVLGCRLRSRPYLCVQTRSSPSHCIPAYHHQRKHSGSLSSQVGRPGSWSEFRRFEHIRPRKDQSQNAEDEERPRFGLERDAAPGATAAEISRGMSRQHRELRRGNLPPLLATGSHGHQSALLQIHIQQNQ